MFNFLSAANRLFNSKGLSNLKNYWQTFSMKLIKMFYFIATFCSWCVTISFSFSEAPRQNAQVTISNYKCDITFLNGQPKSLHHTQLFL